MKATRVTLREVPTQQIVREMEFSKRLSESRSMQVDEVI